MGSASGTLRRASRLSRSCPPVSAAESHRSETEDMNEVEKPQAPAPPHTTARPAPKPKPSAPKKPASRPGRPDTPRTPSSDTPSGTYLGTEGKDFQIMPLSIRLFSLTACFDFAPAAQSIKCETRLRDKCRGLTCNRSDCSSQDVCSLS